MNKELEDYVNEIAACREDIDECNNAIIRLRDEVIRMGYPRDDKERLRMNAMENDQRSAFIDMCTLEMEIHDLRFKIMDYWSRTYRKPNKTFIVLK